jgi:hypothetical protein
MDRKISKLQRDKARDLRIRDLARTHIEVRELLEERDTLATSMEELKAKQAVEKKAK